MLDLGLTYDTVVEPLQKSFWDPIAYLIRGAVIALRSEVASTILVEKSQIFRRCYILWKLEKQSP